MPALKRGFVIERFFIGVDIDDRVDSLNENVWGRRKRRRILPCWKDGKKEVAKRL